MRSFTVCMPFAGGNQRIRIREKTLEFSSTVISTLSPYLVAFDLHMAQLMPLPLTVSCFSKIQIGFTFLIPAHLCSPGKRAVKRVCVCVRACVLEVSYSTVYSHVVLGLPGRCFQSFSGPYVVHCLPPRPQDGTVSVILLFTIVSSCVTDCNYNL